MQPSSWGAVPVAASNAWDDDGRLASATVNGQVETYLYSADGMRQGKVTTSGTVLYVRDGQNVLMETDGSGNVQAYYTHAPGEWGGLVAQWQAAGQSLFYGFDPRGNARILTDGSENIVGQMVYRAFGEQAGSGASTPYGYGDSGATTRTTRGGSTSGRGSWT